MENLPFTQYLLGGRITVTDYVVYLSEMTVIYQHLEQLAVKAGLFKDMEELPRFQRMVEDLEELAPGYRSEPLPTTQRYLAHLTQLANSDHSKHLFAHVYVRHMGDLYGGKLISRGVPGTGRWYEFENRKELVKRFNEKITIDLADEALVAFDHYKNIFQELWTRIHTE